MRVGTLQTMQLIQCTLLHYRHGNRVHWLCTRIHTYTVYNTCTCYPCSKVKDTYVAADFRVSQVAWFKHSKDPVLLNIHRRIERATRYNFNA